MKAVIYMIICLSFCSELIHCSCLSYGHSCWGAHGKRSSPTERIESEPQQQDRWALFKLIQDENDKYYGRDHILRTSADDSMDYNDKLSNNLLVALRKRRFPLVVLNPVDDAAITQENQKPYAAPSVRNRRSSAMNQNSVYDLQDVTTIDPNVPSTFTKYPPKF